MEKIREDELNIKRIINELELQKARLSIEIKKLNREFDTNWLNIYTRKQG